MKNVIKIGLSALIIVFLAGCGGGGGGGSTDSGISGGGSGSGGSGGTPYVNPCTGDTTSEKIANCMVDFPALSFGTSQLSYNWLYAVHAPVKEADILDYMSELASRSFILPADQNITCYSNQCFYSKNLSAEGFSSTNAYISKESSDYSVMMDLSSYGNKNITYGDFDSVFGVVNGSLESVYHKIELSYSTSAEAILEVKSYIAQLTNGLFDVSECRQPDPSVTKWVCKKPGYVPSHKWSAEVSNSGDVVFIWEREA